VAPISGKLLFYEVVNVFGFRIVEKLRRRFSTVADFFQGFHNFGKLFGRKHSGVFESVGVGATGGEFEGQQPSIVGERALPFFKFGVKRLPEAAGPHLHCATSTFTFACVWARQREGNPRMRMKPSASF
jgi:hypothetical protein